MRAQRSEREIAAQVVEWLQSQNWDVYQEVQPRLGTKVCDIVGVMGPLTWCVETKQRYNAAVLEQAVHWKEWAKLVSVATPPRASGSVVYDHFCRSYGIGRLIVSPRDRWSCGVDERIQPRLERRTIWNIGDDVRPEHKTFAAAGNNEGLRWTPYKATCEELRNLVEKIPGIPMKDAIDEIRHHYSSDKVARASLAHWIDKGKVRGIRLERQGRKLYLFPDLDTGAAGA